MPRRSDDVHEQNSDFNVTDDRSSLPTERPWPRRTLRYAGTLLLVILGILVAYVGVSEGAKRVFFRHGSF